MIDEKRLLEQHVSELENGLRQAVQLYFAAQSVSYAQQQAELWQKAWFDWNSELDDEE